MLGNALCAASSQLRGGRMKSLIVVQSMYSFARPEREMECSVENDMIPGPHVPSWCSHARQEGIGRAWEVQNCSDSV